MRCPHAAEFKSARTTVGRLSSTFHVPMIYVDHVAAGSRRADRICELNRSPTGFRSPLGERSRAIVVLSPRFPQPQP